MTFKKKLFIHIFITCLLATIASYLFGYGSMAISYGVSATISDHMIMIMGWILILFLIVFNGGMVIDFIYNDNRLEYCPKCRQKTWHENNVCVWCGYEKPD